MFFPPADPCAGYQCGKGTECDFVPSTGEPFCNPTCDVDNGGCDEDEMCKLAPASCVSPDVPCKNAIQCIGMVNVGDSTAVSLESMVHM